VAALSALLPAGMAALSTNVQRGIASASRGGMRSIAALACCNDIAQALKHKHRGGQSGRRGMVSGMAEMLTSAAAWRGGRNSWRHRWRSGVSGVTCGAWRRRGETASLYQRQHNVSPHQQHGNVAPPSQRRERRHPRTAAAHPRRAFSRTHCACAQRSARCAAPLLPAA